MPSSSTTDYFVHYPREFGILEEESSFSTSTQIFETSSIELPSIVTVHPRPPNLSSTYFSCVDLE